MGSYIPSTARERQGMLSAVGANDLDGLYRDVPASIRLSAGALDLPDGVSELTAAARMRGLAAKNTVYEAIFRGAGAYNHYIPPVVSRIAAKEAFVTAYTPYQPEISQGVLQSIFEYQTMIAELTGMDVSNASVYDGAVAASEAASMCREGKRTVALVSEGARGDIIRTMRTYGFGSNTEVVTVPLHDGRTDIAALTALLSDTAASFLFQYPTRFGVVEDAEALIAVTHAAGAKCVMHCDPTALAALRTPGELGADIAVGDGQPLGMPLSFGGPYLGYMTCKKAMMRKLPGRIVGQTTDAAGARCFVLTLQAREQHIRREKAASNICSNQALCALTAAAYLATMGPTGMQDCARLCYDKAHYLSSGLAALGFPLRYPDAPFFMEFITETPVDAEALNRALASRGILGGLPTDGGILWCATEMNDREQLDALLACVKEVACK